MNPTSTSSKILPNRWTAKIVKKKKASNEAFLYIQKKNAHNGAVVLSPSREKGKKGAKNLNEAEPKEKSRKTAKPLVPFSIANCE